MYTLRGRRDARAVSRLGVHPAKESNPMRFPFLSCLASLVIAVPLVAQGLSENPSPQPPPLKGEGEQDQYSTSSPPLRCGEGVGGRGFGLSFTQCPSAPRPTSDRRRPPSRRPVPAAAADVPPTPPAGTPNRDCPSPLSCSTPFPRANRADVRAAPAGGHSRRGQSPPPVP